jgi:uncharacterized membrane protein
VSCFGSPFGSGGALSDAVPLPGTSSEYDRIEKLINTLVFDVAFDQLISRILNEVPFLGYPVIKQIFTFTTRKLLQLFYTFIEKELSKLVISAEVEAERKAYDAAVIALKEQLSKQEVNPDEIERARQEMRNRLRDLIRFPR